MTVTAARQKTWRFPRVLVEDHVALLLMVFAGFVITVMAIALVYSRFNDVTGSIWEHAAGAGSWYVAFFAGYVMFENVPLYVANGRTRHDTAIEVLIFAVILATVTALLMTLGFAIEYGVYAIADWPRELGGDHFFDSYSEVPTIFAEYWLMIMVWAASGAMVGAAFYRFDSLGWLSLVPASIFVGLIGINEGPQFMGFILNRVPSLETASLLVYAVICAICCLLATAATWPIVRDMPLRNK